MHLHSLEILLSGAGCSEEVVFRKYFTLVFLFSAAAWSQGISGNPPVLTGQYNASRTSANPNEVLLNTVDVNPALFGKLFSWSVDGAVRAQPLFVPQLNIAGKVTDVVYVATMGNSIYAFDANNPGARPLWRVNFGAPVTAPTSNGCPAVWSTGPVLGILSTPVIDMSTGTLYAVSAAPSGGGYVHYIHALDIATGNDRPGSPNLIQASVPGTGYNAQNGRVTMGPASEEIQRTALLLANGSVYAGFGNCGPDHDPYHGWVIGYSAANVTNQTVLFNSTPNGGQGGIWQSGRGGVVDGAGDLYFTTGNATPTAVTTGTGAGDAAQGNYPMRLLQLSSAGQVMSGYPPLNYSALNDNDLDFSSSGAMLLPNSNLILAGGKDGVMYLFNAGNLSTPVQSFQATGDGPCTYSFTGCDQIHDYAFWNNRLYVWGTNDVLRVFNFANGQFNPTAASRSVQPGGATAPTVAVSANGSLSGTGIVWAATGDNVLHAFNAENVATELWNSNQVLGRDALPMFSRFAEATVANGRVYVATSANQVVAYGMLGDFSLATSALSQTAIRGGLPTSTTISLTPMAGFAGPVTLSVSGLPAGATASFAPPALSTTGATTLTISTSASTPTGTYNLIVSGTGGGMTRTTNLTFIVTLNDTVAPTWTCCSYTARGSSYVLTLTAQDTGSGMASITPVDIVGAIPSVPTFAPGTTTPITFQVTESGWASYVKFALQDVAGNISYVDSVLMDPTRTGGKPVVFGVKDITAHEGVITIENGTPGLKNVRIEVDSGLVSSKVQVPGLKDGEMRVVPITSLLPTSGATSVTITPLGASGGTALFVFASGPMAGLVSPTPKR